MQNLFILDHYYAVDHKEFCIIIESGKNITEIMQICSSITFLLEYMFDESVCLDMNCLLNALLTYYGAEDKKAELKDILSMIELPINGIYETVLLPDFYDNAIYIIDLYEARESCCGPNYKELMNNNLPKGAELQQLKNLLKETGIEK